MSTEKRSPSGEDMQLAAAIYERHKGAMILTASEYLKDPSLVQDAVHDAVLRLAAYAPTLRGLSEAARARYARETVRTVALNLNRRLNAERGVLAEVEALREDLPGDESPERAFLEQTERERRLRFLREALDELDEADRALLTGKYLLGQSDELLAQRLGVKPASVRMRLTRARRELRRRIEGKEGRQ